jgi:hypothetical protein
MDVATVAAPRRSGGLGGAVLHLLSAVRRALSALAGDDDFVLQAAALAIVRQVLLFMASQASARAANPLVRPLGAGRAAAGKAPSAVLRA